MKIKYHHSFKKDYKLMKKRGFNLDKLKYVINQLVN